MDLIPKMQVNVVLSDHNVEKAVETIMQAARTGKPGDGLIFVYPVEDIIFTPAKDRPRRVADHENSADRLAPACRLACAGYEVRPAIVLHASVCRQRTTERMNAIRTNATVWQQHQKC
jgi:hypothetical protein